MAETILSSPLFTDIVLPFLLVFTIVFAILQKTSVLGKGKRQIDAIVALVIGLIVVSFGFATEIISTLMPVLAVSAVVIFVFMVLYGMAHKEGELELPGKVKGLIGVLAAIVVVVTLLFATGAWNFIYDWLYLSGSGEGIVANIVFVIIIAAVIGAVLWGGGKNDK